MCILIYAGKNETIPHDHLVESCITNPDGFGWAIITKDGNIIRGRTMDAAEAIADFEQARERYPELPCLFHARISTHGTTSLDNCHPFWVDEGQKTILAHNGIIHSVDARGFRSDTRVFAEDWMPHLTEMLDDKEGFRELERFIGYGSKVVILTVDETLDNWSYILGEGAGHWDKGVWYSNYSYIPARSYTRMYDSWGAWPISDTGPVRPRSWQTRTPIDDGSKEFELKYCSFCQERMLVDLADNECPTCRMCVACEHWQCQCDQPIDFEEVDRAKWFVTKHHDLLVWDGTRGHWSLASDADVVAYSTVWGIDLELLQSVDPQGDLGYVGIPGEPDWTPGTLPALTANGWPILSPLGLFELEAGDIDESETSNA